MKTQFFQFLRGFRPGMHLIEQAYAAACAAMHPKLSCAYLSDPPGILTSIRRMIGRMTDLQTRLLHVITAEIGSSDDAEYALRALRRASGLNADDGRTLLLFCDLAASQVQKMPQDESLIRSLQSSVMAMNARRPGRFHLLVRRRQWDDVRREYIGAAQQTPVHRVLLDLIESGETQIRFECATVSPAALRSCCSAVLFSSASLSCTPDTPLRMLAALESAPSGCLRADTLHRHTYPESVLDRLIRAGFSLTPFRDAREAAMRREGLADPFGPAIFTPSGLYSMLKNPEQPVPLLPDCIFVQEKPASLVSVFSAFREDCLRLSAARISLPAVQLLLLFTAALSGYTPLAAASVLLPEIGSLRFIRRLPAALLRLALLPLRAFLAFDALLMRWQVQTKHFRLCVPSSFFSAQAVSICGSLLLICALSGASALAALLPVCLFWLLSPLLIPALQAPTIERIPLTEDQLSQLRSEAESAFFDCIAHSSPQSSPALHMLCACAGSMLGLLEPDEAARCVHRLLDPAPVLSHAADVAAALVSAQYLREHMGACDAALRELPAQLEAFALSAPAPSRQSALSAFLSCAYKSAAPGAILSLKDMPSAVPAELLFLPLGPASRKVPSLASLALTHPHTYLRRSASGALPASDDVLMRFLFLAATALSHPFHALLMRSPVCAPYASLWAV